MRRALLMLVLATPAASAAIGQSRETVSQALARTAAEERAAEARVATLGRREAAATNDAARLAAERQRAAADIDLAEVRLAAADLALAEARGEVARREQSLAARRSPLAALLAGLATMSRRPPILTLADGASVSEVIRVRALVDTTMPLIARRSAALAGELGAGRKLAARAAAARQAVAGQRADLAAKQRSFAALEAKALGRAADLRRSVAGAEDQVMAGGESVLDLRDAERAAAAARSATRALATLPLAPRRPFAADGAFASARLDYVLPVAAPVSDGMGAVDSAGIRSQGITFATARGAVVVAPGAGKILFAGPFRDQDGVIIIDHGGGWTSLLTGITPSVARGERIAAGAPLGRTIGDLTLELRYRRAPRSPALIAGSSRLLSNGGKTR